MMSDTGLRLAVRKQLGSFRVDADLALPARGVSALFGASGSGKTSLLRLIAGLDRPDEGSIRLGTRTLADTRQGLFVPPHRRRIGIVFQEPRLFPHYRVRGNLTYGMPDSARDSFDAIVALLGIGTLLERFPGTLSGGEAQRVSIGRALLTAPELLLMDEPLSGLDGARKDELLQFILSLVNDVDIPILYISHDPKELVTIADHLVVLENGGVLASDALESVLQRIDLTRHLGGFDLASVLPAEVVAHDDAYDLTRLRLDDGQTLTLPRLAASPGSRLRVRIPARDVGLALSPLPATGYRNQLQAVIERIATLPDGGPSMELLLSIGSHHLRARLTRKSCDELRLTEGMSVTALIRTVSFDTRRLEPAPR